MKGYTKIGFICKPRKKRNFIYPTKTTVIYSVRNYNKFSIVTYLMRMEEYRFLLQAFYLIIFG